MNEQIIEIKNLLNSINEESDGIENILQDKDDRQEYIEYLDRLIRDSIVAMYTTQGDTFLKYRHRTEALLRIANIIYTYYIVLQI